MWLNTDLEFFSLVFEILESSDEVITEEIFTGCIEFLGRFRDVFRCLGGRKT